MYNPNEPRVQSGSHAGEWTSFDASEGLYKAASDNPEDAESIAESIKVKYKNENPHSGGVLTGDVQKFDALSDDADIWVFTATTPENAKAMVEGKIDHIPNSQEQKMNSLSDKIYAASDPRVVSGLGKTIVGFRLKKSDLSLSPEAVRAKQTLGQAVRSVATGTIITGKPSFSVIVEQQQRYNESAKLGHEALAETYYKSKKNGDNPKLIKVMEKYF